MALAALEPGDELAPMSAPPISRLALALYAGASGDHNPIHVDLDFARQHGMDDVFAHGMLAAAYLGRMLTDGIPQPAIRSFSVRFAAIIQVHDRLSCRGRVLEKFSEEGELRARLELAVTDQDDVLKVTGEAVVALV